ncbi:MAG: hypothetical protein K2F68_08290, partial [Duncaniella sp.]|nr:hypothetical protein [Duncaniella sp.]
MSIIRVLCDSEEFTPTRRHSGCKITKKDANCVLIHGKICIGDGNIFLFMLTEKIGEAAFSVSLADLSY